MTICGWIGIQTQARQLGHPVSLYIYRNVKVVKYEIDHHSDMDVRYSKHAISYSTVYTNQQGHSDWTCVSQS